MWVAVEILLLARLELDIHLGVNLPPLCFNVKNLVSRRVKTWRRGRGRPLAVWSATATGMTIIP